MRLIEDTGQTCCVSPFTQEYAALVDVKIVKAATAYVDPDTFETIILVLNQALWFGDKLENSLICPQQLRKYHNKVDDQPIQFVPTSTHSLYFPREDLRIKLMMDGYLSYFETRTPTDYELENCRWVELTEDIPWDPYSPDFAAEEAKAVTRPYQPTTPLDGPKGRSIAAFKSHFDVTQRSLAAVCTSLSDDPLLQDLEAQVQVRSIDAVQSASRASVVTKEKLARMWAIGLDTAAATLRVTTQKGIRNAIKPLHQRYRTKQTHLRYNQLASRFYSDTFIAKHKSYRGNVVAQVFVNDTDFVRVYPMKSKGDAGLALMDLIQEVGVPSELHTDNAGELTTDTWGRVCREMQIRQTSTEPHSPWQNRAESAIRELKKSVLRIMHQTRTPRKLWDFAAEYVADIRVLTANPLHSLHGRTPYEIVTGNTPDISEWLEFEWYQPVWYYDSHSFPGDKRLVGRWLGVAHRVGQAMCYWILPPSGHPIARTTIQPITDEEKGTTEVRDAVAAFDAAVSSKIGDKLDPELVEPIPLHGFRLQDVEEDSEDTDPAEPEAEMPEADDFDADAYDKFISASVMLPQGGEYESGTVVARKRGPDGNPIGQSHPNPILDTRVYDVQFPDGHVEEFTANVIAECVYSQVDREGRQYLMIKEIVDHKSDGNAVQIPDMWIAPTGSRNKHMRRTTKGWKLCIAWRDGTTTWEPLRNLKESNPVEVAEYAVANRIDHEPAFAWWVKDVLKHRECIIKAVRGRVQKRTHKFGIQVPKTVEEAFRLDAESQTTHWKDAISKEMKNVMTAFEFLEEGQRAPIGYKRIPLHMIFDVKMDFTRKARLVAGGHVTDPPQSMTYSSVVSRESVRIAFLIAALNDLDILAADIGNAYLNALTKEKVYTIAGKEFGNKAGRTVLIVRALYGLKTSGAAFHAHLAQSLRDLGYLPSPADNDVWIRAAVKPCGFEYYEYLLVYVDDILCVSHEPRKTMNQIEKMYRLKNDSIAAPTEYLGATVKQWRFDGDAKKVRWAMSSTKYIEAAIKNVELELAKSNKKLFAKPTSPLSSGYRPELDTTPLLGAESANYYQNLIGVLRWAVELGRVDIHVAVAMLSRYLVQPRQGHLDQVFHLFAYLKRHERSNMVFDETRPPIDERRFTQHDWETMYHDAKEAIPLNALSPRGNAVQMNAYVDADHAGDRVTRRSHTGIVIFLNRAPIVWYSKRQNTVETSTFGSEFVALKVCTEMIKGLWYKLRMFGIPIDGPTNVFCDNQAV